MKLMHKIAMVAASSLLTLPRSSLAAESPSLSIRCVPTANGVMQASSIMDTGKAVITTLTSGNSINFSGISFLSDPKKIVQVDSSHLPQPGYIPAANQTQELEAMAAMLAQKDQIYCSRAGSTNRKFVRVPLQPDV